MVRSSLTQAFAEADTRGLGLFRIAFGLGLMGYLVTRVTDDSFIAWHTNLGVLPNHYALFNPHLPGAWSFLYGVSTPWQVGIAMAAIGGVLLCFTIGYRTRF